MFETEELPLQIPLPGRHVSANGTKRSTTAGAEGDDSPKARHRLAQRAYRAREKLKAEIREGVFLKLAQKHQDDALAFAEEIAETRGMDFNEVMDIFLYRHGK